MIREKKYSVCERVVLIHIIEVVLKAEDIKALKAEISRLLQPAGKVQFKPHTVNSDANTVVIIS